MVSNKEFICGGSTQGICVQVTTQGRPVRPHLGAPIGTSEYIDRFIEDKIDKWLTELELLSKIALTQPHAAYRGSYTRAYKPMVVHHEDGSEYSRQV